MKRTLDSRFHGNDVRDGMSHLYALSSRLRADSYRTPRLAGEGGLVPRSLLRKSYSQTSKSMSFLNARIGNPEETGTGPPIKTFGGDAFGTNSHRIVF